jgi:hypothetical protein
MWCPLIFVGAMAYPDREMEFLMYVQKSAVISTVVIW